MKKPIKFLLKTSFSVSPIVSMKWRVHCSTPNRHTALRQRPSNVHKIQVTLKQRRVPAGQGPKIYCDILPKNRETLSPRNTIFTNFIEKFEKSLGK